MPTDCGANIATNPVGKLNGRPACGRACRVACLFDIDEYLDRCMAIRDLVTPSNVLAYASAGIAVARTAQRLRARGYASMIIPSRGAVPVMDVARSYYRSILWPHISRADRADIGSVTRIGPLTLTFQAPFTADAGEMGVANLDTSHIRTFWARVVAAIARGDLNNPNYRLYRFVRDEVCKVGHHDSLERRIRGERFIFIDTVVSGQAVSEIVEAFDAEGLDQIHYILMLDENGERMKPQFAWRLRQLEAQGRATLIQVPVLFTEDQGPAVSGVWSVVVPRLMDLARTESVFSDGVVGAGLYYVEVMKREDESNLPLTIANAKLHTLLFQAMHIAADPDHVAEDMDDLSVGFADEGAMQQLFQLAPLHSRYFSYAVEEYVEHIEKNGLFDQACTHRMAMPRLRAGLGGVAANVDVSSSHCLRLDIGEDEAAAFLRRFNASLAEPYWENEDCVRRASRV